MGSEGVVGKGKAREGARVGVKQGRVGKAEEVLTLLALSMAVLVVW